MLFVGNLVLQIVVMDYFLGEGKYTLFGARLLFDFWKGRYWTESGQFPRLTICEFAIRRLGNVNTYNVECKFAIVLE